MKCRVTIQIARKTAKMTSATRVKPAILIALAACAVSSVRVKRTDRQDHVGGIEKGQNDEPDAVIVQHIRARNLRRQLVPPGKPTHQAQGNEVVRRDLEMVATTALEAKHDELVDPEAELSQVDEALARRDEVRIAREDAGAAEARVADIA